MPLSDAQKRAKYRLEALTGIADGKPVCKCCGDARIWSLCFDHIDGGGTAHRRANKNNPTYRLVRAEYRQLGYWPTHRYQILCATCNHGKRVNNNICPHTEEVNMTTQYLNAIKSYVKVFLATVLGLFLSNGADIFAVDFSDARTFISAGIASIVPLFITALDPNDDRFGINS
jgi:hypothetical protein